MPVTLKASSQKSTTMGSHVPFILIFVSYFLIIIWLFAFIARSLPRNWKAAPVSPFIFVGLTAASLVHTWYYMLKYMEWSFINYEQAIKGPIGEGLITRMGAWVHDTSLFTEAWVLVTRHPLNWWWSEQLCLFTTGAWTIFIATEGSRHKVKHLWAYMLLGQIVAISVASNLFYLALVLSPSFSNRKQRQSPVFANPTLWSNVLISLACVGIVPYIKERSFLRNLLTMHAVLFPPLLADHTKTSPYAISTKALYRIVQLVSVLIHGRTALNAVAFLHENGHLVDASSVAQTAWRVLHSHPAQSSIGWDIVWTSASFIVWTLLKPTDSTDAPKWVSVPYLLAATPLASIGVTAPYALIPKPAPPEGEFKFNAKVE